MEYPLLPERRRAKRDAATTIRRMAVSATAIAVAILTANVHRAGAPEWTADIIWSALHKRGCTVEIPVEPGQTVANAIDTTLGGSVSPQKISDIKNTQPNTSPNTYDIVIDGLDLDEQACEQISPNTSE